MSITVSSLPRGGKLVQLGDLRVQLASYPETIKDTLAEEVPRIFVLPSRLFDSELGVSVSDVEFPIYYHYYLFHRQVTLVCRAEQVRPILRTLSEAVFGPYRIDIENEYVMGAQTPGFPDLKAECEFYRRVAAPSGRLRLRDLLDLVLFDDQGTATVEGVEIRCLERETFRFTYQGESVEVSHEPLPRDFKSKGRTRCFEPPSFGVTVIGSGHGFDAETVTAGFVVWVNGKGVLVDPPVHTTRWFHESGIDHRLVDDIILTHCHADHDSGTLQMILREGRMVLHTTPTVLKSFITKYRSITGLQQRDFMRLFKYSPVGIDQPVNICGAEFRFKYRLHSVPTVGFEVFYRGKSFVYSSDTVYCEPTIRRLHSEGVLSASRLEDLLTFPWDHSLVLHETGIGPVHTPVAALAALPDDVKRHLLVIHASSRMIPPESGLRLVPTGVENTLRIEVEDEPRDATLRLLELLAHIDMFRSLTVEKAVEFARMVRCERYEPGQSILAEGMQGERFYMVLSGEVEVSRAGKTLARLGRYEYFGEISALFGTGRTADVTARSAVELASLSRDDFFYFMRGTHLPGLLRRLAENRVMGCWNLLEENALFSSLTSYQKTILLSTLSITERRSGDTLFAEGEPVEHYFLVELGDIRISKSSGKQYEVGRGALLGRVERNLEACHHLTTATCLTDCILYAIDGSDWRRFLATNPGVYMSLVERMETSNTYSFVS
ncbi:MAG: cyclic nucleotide-binding domain-containing protein [Vulcanimicrobiota bacterium]